MDWENFFRGLGIVILMSFALYSCETSKQHNQKLEQIKLEHELRKEKK